MGTGFVFETATSLVACPSFFSAFTPSRPARTANRLAATSTAAGAVWSSLAIATGLETILRGTTPGVRPPRDNTANDRPQERARNGRRSINAARAEGATAINPGSRGMDDAAATS